MDLLLDMQQHFNDTLGLEMERRHWRHVREGPITESKCLAQTKLARRLVFLEEFDAADRLYDQVWRDVAGREPIYSRVVLPAETARAAALTFRRPRDALEILARLLPTVERCRDPWTRVLHCKWTSVALTNRGLYEEAVPYAAHAVDLARLTSGPQSQNALNAMYMQAKLFARMGRIEEARTLLDQVLAYRERTLGPDHHDTRAAQDVLRSITAPTG
mmetsp:Transcript_25560/g.101900  ORF Transcript_25560/g.101900 Transcript_25560/m.101900 type:complete len:217 (+) Transcript_25560:183-833(+)